MVTRLLSLDPSLTRIGFCVLDLEADVITRFGTYKPRGQLDKKLSTAFFWLMLQFDELPPVEVCAIETPVMARNAATTIKLGYLGGALRLAAWAHTDRTISVLPQERLTALGLPARMKRADAKANVLRLVNARYNLELKAKDHDVADAIAVALAAARVLKLEELSE